MNREREIERLDRSFSMRLIVVYVCVSEFVSVFFFLFSRGLSEMSLSWKTIGPIRIILIFHENAYEFNLQGEKGTN